MATSSKAKPRNSATSAKSSEAKRKEHLVHAVHHTAHMLSEQGPMNITFVHNNTLLGLQSSHFHEGIETARQTLGIEGYEPEAKFLQDLSDGRITEVDLDTSLSMQPDFGPETIVTTVAGRPITRAELVKATLRNGAVTPLTPVAIRNSFDPESGLLALGPDELVLERRLAAEGRATVATIREEIGETLTLGAWLGRHFGLDVDGMIEEALCEAAGQNVGADADRSLSDMGISYPRANLYLALMIDRWGDLAALALAIESRLVAEIAAERLDCEGKLDSIVASFLDQPAGYAVRALHSAVLANLYPDGPHMIDHQATPFGSGAGFDTLRPLDVQGLDLLNTMIRSVAPEEQPSLSRLKTALVAGYVDDAELTELCRLAEVAGDTKHRAAARKLAAGTATEIFEAHCLDQANDLVEGLYQGRDLSDLVRELTGIDVAQKVNAAMIRHLSAFTDEGISSLRMPDRHLGLFAAWRQAAPFDELLRFEALEGWQDELSALPEDAGEALIAMLDRIGIPEAAWEPFLGRMLVQLRGWAGMMFWMEIHPRHPKQALHPADTIQYLAVRLFTELSVVGRILQEVCGIAPQKNALADWAMRNSAEVSLRLALHRGDLEPVVAEAASLMLSMRPPTAVERRQIVNLARRAWLVSAVEQRKAHVAQTSNRATRVCAALGLTPQQLADAPGALAVLLSEIDKVDSRKASRIWLEAFETHYRDEVLNALAQNKGRGRWINGRDRRPRSQVVFCIDEREENLHRYYAELDPDHETLGAAGFFGIAIAHSPLGGHDHTPLCPAVATPGHRIAEVPRDSDLDTTWPLVQGRKVYSDAFAAVMWEARRNPLVAYVTAQLTGLFHAVPMVGRVFAPLGYQRVSDHVQSRYLPEVATRLTHTKLPEDVLARLGLHAEALPFGFSIEEAADRVEAQLRNWGLTYQFAPIVVICAHRSFSVNNPHENAHDCGACGGKAGGPNARLFAALANEPAVREVLRSRGIDIPDDSWLVGAEHNTCNDDILIFDVEDIPDELSGAWEVVAKDLEETSRRAARERCRRFRSAPKDASTESSWSHVKARSQDLSQVRPEWGHATNAFALVGRRALTQGLFFDRRGFVISYDPTQDSDGTVLERILLAVGPVGAGINLEYYFSTVNPDGYGSGTKVPHNVVGMIGVMPGAEGDLATGLPRQMTEVHEAMRLQLIVDAPLAVLGEIYGRQPGIQELLNGQWVHLIAHDPETCTFHRFVPGVGFEQWDKPLTELAEVDHSYEWIRGKHDCFLPPARIKEPQARWDAVLH
ncbi:putative inorganic carbon transporter subunit DabA [Anianabacter salinae]|uniref:putative inorganic carbon transporter subunit DabA n=1 Tax=Anianabacter salinae TaxID=2851023 RepID=UPI00225E1EA4|nr:putative inorganic carbon transporter subunit DabA [Anianabacter salinae]MBV0912757.1 DUF2309 domain-containing protein [Anianabacter salinae]